MTNILPCPWCGHTAKLFDVRGYRPNVNCESDFCCAHGPDSDSAADAIAAWNCIAGRRDPEKMVYEVYLGERMIFTEKESAMIQHRIALAVAEEREACIAAIRARGAKGTTQ